MKLHWTLMAGMLLGAGSIVARRLGLELNDFLSGFISAITIVFCISGIIQSGKQRTIKKFG